MPWTVFLEHWQQSSPGYDFAIGDEVDWPVVLIDGVAGGWPENLLTEGSFELVRHPAGINQRGSIAVGAGIQAWWLGPEPPGSRLHLHGVLREDHHVLGLVRTLGTVTRIRLVNQVFEMDDDGVLQPTWSDASFTELTRSTRRFASVRPGKDSRVARRGDTGLLVSLEPEPDDSHDLRLCELDRISE